MKTVALSFAAFAVAVAVIVALISGGGEGSSDAAADPASAGSTAQAPPREPAEEPAACQSDVRWDEAADHVGQKRTVTGRVESAIFAKETNSTPTYLNVGRPYPDERRFVAVIFGDDRGNFRRPPEATYEGKDIAVTGEITLFHGIPQVIVNHPKDIEICPL